MLYINGANVFESAPINGLYPVDPDGTINLGSVYGGSVRVVDLTTDDIQQGHRGQGPAVRQERRASRVSLAQSPRRPADRRPAHRPPGRHGRPGQLRRACTSPGMTSPRRSRPSRRTCRSTCTGPEVAVDVYAYNSKFYYVITDFAGQRRAGGPAAAHRQRDGARRDLAHRRAVGRVQQEDLGRPPGPDRVRPRPDPAGGLERHHPPRPGEDRTTRSCRATGCTSWASR